MASADQKLEHLLYFAENNIDLFLEYSPREVLDLIEGKIQTIEREIEALTKTGVLHYEAVSEAHKLRNLDTPYSLLMDYLIERYDVDSFCMETKEKVLGISRKYREVLLDEDFDNQQLQTELEQCYGEDAMLEVTKNEQT